MPSKDMKSFLHDFFNPPKFSKPSETKKKVVKKKVKKKGPTLSPLQRQLKETDDYMKNKMEEFEFCQPGSERVTFVLGAISEDATSIDRLWPTKLNNKDSRIRRENSELGKASYVAGEFDKTLQFYNEAILFSSGKGLAHTLARRAAFLLQTSDHLLALRDLSIALDYGCLETELLDFLIAHHTLLGTAFYDEQKTKDIIVGKALERKYNAGVTEKKRSVWIEKIRNTLDGIHNMKKENEKETKQVRDSKLDEIIKSIKQASKEENFDVNFETPELDVPVLDETNPLYPALSRGLDVVSSLDRGRHVIANRNIRAGELLAVEEPIIAMLCPEKNDDLKHQCLHCFRFTKAPLACEKCCAVVFCSVQCRNMACSSYHKYECDIRLYELLPLEGLEFQGLFLALRAVTQRDLDYFIQQKDVIEIFLDQEESMFPMSEGEYESLDYKTLLNLMSHLLETPEDISLRNSVVSVFFLRCLQHARYFIKRVPAKMKGERGLHPHELLILRVLQHLISVQSFNLQPIMKLYKSRTQYTWERVGLGINTTLALVNHSCNPNTIRCSVNQRTILVASENIAAGQEVTDSYSVHYSQAPLSQREYHTLKHYYFQCECPACLENWLLEGELPDYLARIPNWEQEKQFVVRFGDKKDVVDQILRWRGEADTLVRAKEYDAAARVLADLIEVLCEHIKQPHAFFLEARAALETCVWNQYCYKEPILQDQDFEPEVETNAKIPPAVHESKARASKTKTPVHTPENVDVEADLVDNKNVFTNNKLVTGASNLIKAFEKTKKDKQKGTEKEKVNEEPSVLSPTLRKYCIPDNLKKDKKIVPEKKFEVLTKAKRKTSPKNVMVERMAAFQPKHSSEFGNASTKKEGNVSNTDTIDVSKPIVIKNNEGKQGSLKSNTEKKSYCNQEITNKRKEWTEKENKIDKIFLTNDLRLKSLSDRSKKIQSTVSEKDEAIRKMNMKSKLMLEKTRQKEMEFKMIEMAWNSEKNVDDNAATEKVNEKPKKKKIVKKPKKKATLIDSQTDEIKQDSKNSKDNNNSEGIQNLNEIRNDTGGEKANPECDKSHSVDQKERLRNLIAMKKKRNEEINKQLDSDIKKKSGMEMDKIEKPTDEDDLLFFLRKAHKTKSSIYEYAKAKENSNKENQSNDNSNNKLIDQKIEIQPKTSIVKIKEEFVQKSSTVKNKEENDKEIKTETHNDRILNILDYNCQQEDRSKQQEKKKIEEHQMNVESKLSDNIKPPKDTTSNKQFTNNFKTMAEERSKQTDKKEISTYENHETLPSLALTTKTVETNKVIKKSSEALQQSNKQESDPVQKSIISSVLENSYISKNVIGDNTIAANKIKNTSISQDHCKKETDQRSNPKKFNSPNITKVEQETSFQKIKNRLTIEAQSDQNKIQKEPYISKNVIEDNTIAAKKIKDTSITQDHCKKETDQRSNPKKFNSPKITKVEQETSFQKIKNRQTIEAQSEQNKIQKEPSKDNKSWRVSKTEKDEESKSGFKTLDDSLVKNKLDVLKPNTFISSKDKDDIKPWRVSKICENEENNSFSKKINSNTIDNKVTKSYDNSSKSRIQEAKTYQSEKREMVEEKLKVEIEIIKDNFSKRIAENEKKIEEAKTKKNSHVTEKGNNKVPLEDKQLKVTDMGIKSEYKDSLENENTNLSSTGSKVQNKKPVRNDKQINESQVQKNDQLPKSTISSDAPHKLTDVPNKPQSYVSSNVLQKAEPNMLSDASNGSPSNVDKKVEPNMLSDVSSNVLNKPQLDQSSDDLNKPQFHPSNDILNKSQLNPSNDVLNKLQLNSSCDVLEEIQPNSSTDALNKSQPQLSHDILNQPQLHSSSDKIKKLQTISSSDVLNNPQPDKSTDMLDKQQSDKSSEMFKKQQPNKSSEMLRKQKPDKSSEMLNKPQPDSSSDIIKKPTVDETLVKKSQNVTNKTKLTRSVSNLEKAHLVNQPLSKPQRKFKNTETNKTQNELTSESELDSKFKSNTESPGGNRKSRRDQNKVSTDNKKVDAFGMQVELKRRSKSVSQMRESYLGNVNSLKKIKNKSEEFASQKSLINKITISTSEVKSKFESSQISSKPPTIRSPSPVLEVSQQMSEFKNKFEVKDTKNIKLPYPNFKRPPPPKSKPPPPPPM